METVVINETGVEVISVGVQGPPGPSSTPSGSDKQVQYNSGGSTFGGAAGVTVTDGATLKLVNQTDSEPTLVLRTTNTQTSNSLEVKNAGGAVLASIDEAGVFSGGGSGLTNLDPTNLSTVVPITKGGTGQTSSNAAFNALAPSQGGNANKYLQTDGTNTSWQAVSAGVTSVSNSDGSLTVSPTTGAVVASLNTNKANTWTQPITTRSPADGTAYAPFVAQTNTSTPHNALRVRVVEDTGTPANSYSRLEFHDPTNGNSVGYLGYLKSTGGISTNQSLVAAELYSTDNVIVGGTSVTTDGQKVVAIGNTITPPSTSPADEVQMWSADVTAGNAALHVKGEGTDSVVALGRMDVRYGGHGLLIGADNNLTTRTNATTKVCRMAVPHYTNSEKPLGLFIGQSSSATNEIIIGGGSSIFNAATSVKINAASNTTTTDGTTRLEVTNASTVNSQTLVVRQSGGVAGTDEVQISHDGSNGFIESKDGDVRLTTGNVQLRVSTGGPYLTSSGAAKYFWSMTAGMVIGGGLDLLFSGAGDVGASGDVGLRRPAAGYLKFTDGSTGDGYFVESVNAAVAAAGNSQGAATAVTKQINQITSATGGSADGVVLPAAVAGRTISIANESGATVKVYPASGAAIDDLGSNNSYNMADNAHVQFKAISTTKWLSF